MSVLTIESRVYPRGVQAFAKIVDDESDRLCAIIESASTPELREQALQELKDLAQNVRIVLSALKQTSAESELREVELGVAA